MIDQPSIILLDNDPLIRMIWELAAKKKGVLLKTFSQYSTLLETLDSTSKATLFYVDYNLGRERTGLEICEELYSKGYCNLTLATGERFSSQDYYFLKAVIDKEPPF